MKEGGIAEFCSEEIITARGAAPRDAPSLRACVRARRSIFLLSCHANG